MTGFCCRSFTAWTLLLSIGLLAGVSLLTPNFALAVQQDDGAGWYTDLDEAKKKSRISGMPILIKFEADWCGPCKELSKEFKKPQMTRLFEQVVPVTVDVDKQEDLARSFDVTSIPKVILIDDAETVLANKIGFAPAADWKTWIEESLEDTEFSMPDELASFDPPTSTEVEELLLRLKAKDAALREVAMERLVSFPAKTRKPVVDCLTSVTTAKPRKKPSLSQQLAVLEVLKRWGAPTTGIDPWTPASFTQERLKEVKVWTETPIEELSGNMSELTEADLEQAKGEIDQLLAGRSVKAGLSRLTRYGQALLPEVYERIKVADSDEQVARLTALRYWLTASNQLRLGWSGGLIELAGRDAASRRSAAAVLVKRAQSVDQALLMELFADSDPLVRELALKGLNGLGSEDTEKAMVRLLKDPDPNVRAAVLKQFAESETQSAVDAVAEYLKTETDAGLVVQAIRFMREVGGSTAVNSIASFVNHESWQVRAELAESLGKIDEDDLSSKVNSVRVTAIIKLMSDEDSFVVVKASESMPSAKDLELVETLAGIASDKPEIAEKIIESLLPDRYDDDAVDVSKFLLGFMDSEHVQVRRGGLKGLQSSYASKLNDTVLTKAIQDQDEKNRILGMRAFVKRLASIRPDAPEERGGHQVGSGSRPVRVTPDPPTPFFSRLFGFGSNSTPAVEVPELKVLPEAGETQEESLEPEQAEDEPTQDADEPTEETEEPVEESEESELEQWLKKFVAGEIKDTKYVRASEAIKKALAEATSEDEIFSAGVALAAYGESERIPGLIESAKTEDMKRQLAGVLIWVPFEERVKLVDAVVSPESTEAELDLVINSFASVSNPAGASVLWKLAGYPNVDLDVVRRSFYELIFDGNVSYYSLDPIQGRNEKLANQLVETVPAVAEMGDNTAMLALVLLNHVDQTKAKELAKKLADGGRSDAVKHMAARVQLRTEKYIVDQWGDRTASADRSHAVDALSSKNPVQLMLALKYIAFGEEILNLDQSGDEPFQIVPYSYGGSGTRRTGTAKLFDPPKGMTEAMLDFKGQELDEEGQAYVTYFRSLFDEKTDLKPLIDFYNQHPDNVQTNKLVYRAIATTNDDDLVGVVEKIYEFNEEEKDDESEIADLYWTIRPMDGDNALNLRKRIRDAQGVNRLKNY